MLGLAEKGFSFFDLFFLSFVIFLELCKKFINIIRVLFLQKGISGHACLKQLDQHSYQHQLYNPDNFFFIC